MNPSFKMSADTRFIRQKLETIPVGGFISYEDLEKAVSKSLAEFQPSLSSARRSLLNEDGYVFDVVRGKGLKRLADEEIVDASQRDVVSIRRKAQKGVRKLTAVDDFNAMSPKKQLDHTIRMSALSMIADVSTDRKMKRLEKAATGRSNQLPIAETLKLFMEK